MNLIFYIIFCIYARRTINKKPEKEDQEEDRNAIISFMKTFSFWGSVYLLSFPIVVIISSAVIAPYLRHKVVTIGSITIQIVVSIVLTYLFSSKRTQYFQVAMKGRTLLPSGKLD